MPDWLTTLIATSPYALAVIGFMWRLERRVFRIELLLKLKNGKG